MIDIAKIRCDQDTQLMLRVMHGDTEAYAELYVNHISDVTSFFRQTGKADGWSEDLAQDVFTCFWKYRESFRAESTFKTYMYGIAKIILKKHTQYLHQEAEITKITGIPRTNIELSQPEAAYSYNELLKNIEKSKLKLSKKQRQAIELSLDPDFSREKAAKKAHCSYNTYCQQLFAGRKKLEKLLKK